MTAPVPAGSEQADGLTETIAVAISSPTLPPKQAMFAYEETAERVAAAVRAHLAASLDAAREDVARALRVEWADWLESWSGAVCPEPPTITAVIEWLRADHLPFGCSANLAARLTSTDGAP